MTSSPWHAVSDQTRRWIDADVFTAMIADLRELIRIGEGRSAQPSAVILDSHPLQSTPERGERAGWDGAKRRRGSKVHLAVDTLGHLRALHVTPANEQDRAQVAELVTAVQVATGKQSPWPPLIRDTPERHPGRQRPTRASCWRSCGCRGVSAGSSCCRDVG